MIKREFWENIAKVWSKREEINIPIIIDGPDVPDDLVEWGSEEIEDLDDMLKDWLRN